MFNHQCFKKVAVSCRVGLRLRGVLGGRLKSRRVAVFHRLHVGSGLWGTQQGHTPQHLGRVGGVQVGGDSPQLGRPAFSFQMGYSIFFLIRSHTFLKKMFEI